MSSRLVTPAIRDLSTTIVLLILASGGPAWAQDEGATDETDTSAETSTPEESAPTATDEDDENAAKAKARGLLDEGNAHLRDGQFEAALAKYRAAFDAFASPKINLNIAEACKQLGDNASAYAAYEAFLAKTAPENELYAAAATRRDELEPKLARIVISVNVDGAAVHVDERDRGASPISPLVVNPGRHSVTANLVGYVAHSEDVMLTAGETKQIAIELAPDVPSEPVIVAETSPSKPVTSKWWFWAAIGAVVVVGAGVAIAATTGGDSFVPMGELGSSSTADWQPL